MGNKLPLKVLYIEDEPKLNERICIVLRMHFASVISAANGREGLELYSCERPDIVVSDIKMPIMDGLEMTVRLREQAPDAPIILTTAFTETEYLLKAIELGVCAYVRKPLDCRQLVETITRIATPLLQKIELTEARQREQSSLELLIGTSPAMQKVIQQARRIADTDYSILIQGETGVGKSRLASIIHGLSNRKSHTLIPVTLGTLSETLVESQLFGHVRGAFTGAVSTRKGLFEEANGGTVFLDDVDCASPTIQAKILQVVEQKKFFPVGATKPVDVDIRVITASNRDLFDEVHGGNFREDLYYRLNDLIITIPPLRERREDISEIARLFLNEISQEHKKSPPHLTAEALSLLQNYHWPGNVRELKSVIKRAALFADEVISGHDLSSVMGTPKYQVQNPYIAIQLTLDELTRQAVRQALEASGGKKMEAARVLDVDYGKFKRMLERYQI